MKHHPDSQPPAWIESLPVEIGAEPPVDGTYRDWGWLSRAVVALAPSSQTVIGISGSQGSGKSTFAAILARAFAEAGIRRAAVSIDDFYLGRNARLALAEAVHPLLVTRGVPGTHETGLIERALRGAKRDGVALDLPRFDKGSDDRAGRRRVETSGLIFEGWCLGVTAEPSDALAQPINALEAREDPDGTWRNWVNERIIDGYQPLWGEIDFWVQLKAPGFDQVRQWRAQQERMLPASQQMDARTLARFIDHYERLTRHMWENPAPAPGLSVELAPDHSIAGVELFPAP